MMNKKKKPFVARHPHIAVIAPTGAGLASGTGLALFGHPELSSLPLGVGIIGSEIAIRDIMRYMRIGDANLDRKKKKIKKVV